jgi:hypothetical protein
MPKYFFVFFLTFTLRGMISEGVKVTPSDTASTLIKDGWFSETEAMWPGQKFCIEVDEVLLNGRSEFQVNDVFVVNIY